MPEISYGRKQKVPGMLRGASGGPHSVRQPCLQWDFVVAAAVLQGCGIFASSINENQYQGKSAFLGHNSNHKELTEMSLVEVTFASDLASDSSVSYRHRRSSGISVSLWTVMSRNYPWRPALKAIPHPALFYCITRQNTENAEPWGAMKIFLKAEKPHKSTFFLLSKCACMFFRYYKVFKNFYFHYYCSGWRVLAVFFKSFLIWAFAQKWLILWLPIILRGARKGTPRELWTKLLCFW